MSVQERRSMVSSDGRLSLRQQCILLGLCRSTFYYTPATESKENLKIMELLDNQYFKTPFYGQRRLQIWLRTQGHEVNIKRLRRLMNLVRWRTLFPQMRTTHCDPKAYKYPYLLKGLDINRCNQVWELDISYIPMAHGFMYLFAIIDVHSRFVVGWSLSNTMSAEWCCSVISEAIATYGKPEIINSDQGSQFTSNEYIKLLMDNEIRISMDGRGRALDDIYIERLWRSVKYEHIYIHSHETCQELWRGLTEYFDFYNHQRPHQSLDYQPPVKIYGDKIAA